MTEFKKLKAYLVEEHGDEWYKFVVRFAIGGDDIRLLSASVPGLIEWLDEMIDAGFKAAGDRSAIKEEHETKS